MNVYRSRYSINEVAKLVTAHQESRRFEYSHIVLARLDTAFLSPLEWRPQLVGVTIPNFEHGGASFNVVQPKGESVTLTIGGVNDRFAYGDGRSMLHAYMAQYEQQLSSVDGVRMTTSETLLCRQLVGHNVSVALTPICIVRVRATGELARYHGLTDLVYPPRGQPMNCEGLRLVSAPGDTQNACDGLTWQQPPANDAAQREYTPPIRTSVDMNRRKPPQDINIEVAAPKQETATGRSSDVSKTRPGVRCVGSACFKRVEHAAAMAAVKHAAAKAAVKERYSVSSARQSYFNEHLPTL